MAETDDQETSPETGSKHATPSQMVAAIVLGVLVIAISYVVFVPAELPDDLIAAQQALALQSNAPMPEIGEPRSLDFSNFTNHWSNQFVLWWDDVSTEWKNGTLDTGTNSNVQSADYVGSDSCRECHKENHDAWLRHGHHRMTAYASDKSVVGDFSGNKSIDYEGGSARFYKSDGNFFMETMRDGKKWTYRITRTIGWRHMQDYAGFLVSGPDELGLNRDRVEHVLPFAYDVSEQEWMPPVHVHPDDDIPDSFEPHTIVPYSQACSDCHNAYPVGDRMVRRAGIERWAAYVPRSTALQLSAYLSDAHPETMTPGKPYTAYRNEEVVNIGHHVRNLKLEETIHLQGITCEACHYGGREHAAASTKETSSVLPAFYPISPHVKTAAASLDELHAKSTENINFICARCHSGARQQYANGLHAWNSTEYTEAMNGHCYDPVKARQHGMQAMACTHCHSPHDTSGLEWTRTPAQDDASCLKCHEQFKETVARKKHTHHAPGPGDHCMDCHMPHTNEGLGRMVRTHRIVNPIDKTMIEANQVNACNLCHLDKSITWTIDALQQWYRPEFKPSVEHMAKNYQDQNAAVVHEWIRSPHPPTRIAAAGAIARNKAHFALPDLLDQLAEEEYGYNQRVMQKAADELLDKKLRSYDFKYHLPVEERKKMMKRLKPILLKPFAAKNYPADTTVASAE